MQKPKNINITLKHNLCLSCEICMSVCPENAISMEFKSGRIFPVINEDICTDCGICRQFCPGIDIDQECLNMDKNLTDYIAGNYLDCYSGYRRDTNIRLNSTSGGIITSLLIRLINKGEYESAFICNFKKFDPKGTRLIKTNREKVIIESSRSKYIPASVFNIIEELKDYKGEKFIVVATPCMTAAIKKYTQNNPHLAGIVSPGAWVAASNGIRRRRSSPATTRPTSILTCRNGNRTNSRPKSEPP